MAAPRPNIPAHGLLTLPFTPALLQDPSPILPAIYDSVQTASTTSLTVLFSTPDVKKQGQLYPQLAAAPRAHWEALAAFLARVYGTLAAGQWKADKATLDVEVHFDGEEGEWMDKVPGRIGVMILYDENPYRHLAQNIRGHLAPSAIRQYIPTPVIPSPGAFPAAESGATSAAYPVSAVGGTFDHLHAAHKLLLHMTLFVSSDRMFAGVISQKLLATKSHHALVQGLDERIAAVRNFLHRLGPGDTLVEVEEIEDAFGPTAWDPEIKALVVSRETLKGGDACNDLRRTKVLPLLDILSVDVISSDLDVDLSEANEAELKARKMGSTGIREWIAKQQK